MLCDRKLGQKGHFHFSNNVLMVFKECRSLLLVNVMRIMCFITTMNAAHFMWWNALCKIKYNYWKKKYSAYRCFTFFKQCTDMFKKESSFISQRNNLYRNSFVCFQQRWTCACQSDLFINLSRLYLSKMKLFRTTKEVLMLYFLRLFTLICIFFLIVCNDIFFIRLVCYQSVFNMCKKATKHIVKPQTK